MNRIRIALLTIALAAAFSAPADAQVQSKAQQACINKIVKTARKVYGAVLKDATQCVRKGAQDKLPMGVTAQNCLFADLKGKVESARNKLLDTETKSCGTPPGFAYIGAAGTSAAYEYDNHGLGEDAFDDDLDATLVGSAGVDESGKCGGTLPGAWRKLEDAMHRAVEACVKEGLKDQSIIDEAGFMACLDEVHLDTRGRIAKGVAVVESKLGTKCPTGDLATIFPGLVPICASYGDGTDAAGIASCSRERLECRICRIFNFAYDVYRDCDLFDDGLSNASCPECGNGVTDSGEECDDTNTTSGDGCDSACVDEFCGDNVVNDSGAEECDDGAGNSSTDPDACRENCQEPSCGDGVTDPSLGEECDDANTNDTDGCTNACTMCGNGAAAGAEQCDDGNTAAGDCCSAACTYEAMGSPCTGPTPEECTAPGCDGAGSCELLPADEGTSCEDDDECSNASECQSGECTATSYVVTGQACRWAVVGNPTDGSGGERRVYLELGADSTGDWCGDFARIGDTTTMGGGDIVTIEGDGSTSGAEIASSANIDTSDVVTNNARVEGLSGGNLPGLVATTTVAAGQVVAKTPSGEYDTTGSDPRVADCAAAQLAISTSTASLLNALTADADLGATLTSVAAMSSHTINAVNVGGLSVIDVDNITGAADVTLNIDGGGNANSVIILRVDTSLNTAQRWTWNLQNGMSAEHFLIYGKGSGLARCELGEDNVGGGTIFCPDSRVKLVLRTQWTGALFGGGTSPFAIDVGENAVLTHQRFTGF